MLTFLLNFVLYLIAFLIGSVIAQFVAEKRYPARNEPEALAELDRHVSEGAAR